jgi:hypothetical protein
MDLRRAKLQKNLVDKIFGRKKDEVIEQLSTNISPTT